MNVKTILSNLSVRPATDTHRVISWLLVRAEKHWASEAEKHLEAAARNRGTSMGVKAETAYTAAFDNWHAIKGLQSNVDRPHRLLGGKQVAS